MSKITDYTDGYATVKVNTANIVVDKKIQRNVDKRKKEFQFIITHFNPYLMQPVILSYRDGQYYCVDGQMTIKTAKYMNGGKDLFIPAHVLYGLTREDESQIFLLQDVWRKSRISRSEKTDVETNCPKNQNGEYLTPECEEADVIFSKILPEYGFDHKIKRAKNRFGCDQALRDSYRYLHELDPSNAMFEQVIRIIRKAWDGAADSLGEDILKGITYFVAAYRDAFDEAHLIKKLSKVDPVKFSDRMKNKSASPYKSDEGKHGFPVWIEYMNRIGKTVKKLDMPPWT